MSESGALLLLGHHFFIYGLAYLFVLDLGFNVSLCVLAWRSSVERETGIEPAQSAWKAEVLPLNYSRAG